MYKPSQGPWFSNEEIVNGNWVINVTTKKGVLVCEVPKTSQSTQTKIANARLIAATPDLLEALQLADAMLSGANMNASVVERKVRAAIAKATGNAS